MLPKGNGTSKKITPKLIELYELEAAGKRDRRIKDLVHLKVDVCLSMHLVVEADEKWGVPECAYNPAKLNCVHCKGFKHVGICSHVLAINQILNKIALRREIALTGDGYNNRTFSDTCVIRQ